MWFVLAISFAFGIRGILCFVDQYFPQDRRNAAKSPLPSVTNNSRSSEILTLDDLWNKINEKSEADKKELKEMIGVLNDRLKTNEDNIADAIRRIESLENNIVPASTSPSINQDDILAEWNERLTRRKNLRMLGITENDHPASSNGNDLTKVRELLGKLAFQDLTIFPRRL